MSKLPIDDRWHDIAVPESTDPVDVKFLVTPMTQKLDKEDYIVFVIAFFGVCLFFAALLFIFLIGLL